MLQTACMFPYLAVQCNRTCHSKYHLAKWKVIRQTTIRPEKFECKTCTIGSL